MRTRTLLPLLFPLFPTLSLYLHATSQRGKLRTILYCTLISKAGDITSPISIDNQRAPPGHTRYEVYYYYSPSSTHCCTPSVSSRSCTMLQLLLALDDERCISSSSTNIFHRGGVIPGWDGAPTNDEAGQCGRAKHRQQCTGNGRGGESPSRSDRLRDNRRSSS